MFLKFDQNAVQPIYMNSMGVAAHMSYCSSPGSYLSFFDPDFSLFS